MSFNLFSTPQPQQQQQSPFSFQPFQNFSSFPPQQHSFQPSLPAQQQQQQQVLFLFTNDKSPANYSTKWTDLHPDSQKFLQKIEERVLEFRDESLKLDQCSRLYDSSIINEGFEVTSSHVLQDLSGITSTLERQKSQLQSLMTIAKDLLRNTEIAIRSYLALRQRFNVGSNPSEQPSSTQIAPLMEFYSGVPKKPSFFLQQTVARFESSITECSQWINEIEQLLSDSETTSLSSKSLLNSLPQVMINVHDFFVHVAAKAEHIHQYIEAMKVAYLAEQRSKGDCDNPFMEADRREKAKSEAVAKRAHPTLHLPAKPHTVPASAASSAPSTALVSGTLASTGSGFSLFNTPVSSSSSMAPSAFSTPASGFPSSSGGAFGPSSSSSLFSTSFSTAASTGASLFSTPFASGSLTGASSSFSTATKSQRPKSRSTRR